MKDRSSKPFPLSIMIGICVVLVIAGGLAWNWLQQPTPPAGADPDNAEQVALGRTVYVDNCAACHGDRLQGQPNWRSRRPDGKLPAPPHDKTGHTWHHGDAKLFAIIKNGSAAYAPKGYKTDMAGYSENLTDAQIWASLAYIKNAWPPEIRNRQAGINKRQQMR